MTQTNEITRFIKSLNTTSVKLSRKPAMPKHSPIFHGRDSLYHRLLTPDRVINRIDTLQIGDEYHAFMGAIGYPGSLSHNWLSTIVDSIDDTNLNFSQFITPIDNDEAVTQLQRHINDIDTEIALNAKSDKITPETTFAKLGAAKDRMKTMTGGTEKSFDIANYFSVHDTDTKKLKRAIASLKSTISGLMIVPSRLYLRSMLGYQCMMPIAIDSIEMTRHMDTTAVARSLAFPGRARIASGMDGTIVGVEFDTGIPIVYDRFNRGNKNANMLVLAQSGAGKTFWTSLDIIHQIEIGNDVVIFDPKPDYIELVEEFGGTNVRITEGSDTCINPFRIGTGPADTLTSKIVELPAFIGLLVGGVTDAAENALLTCVEKIYIDRGILPDDPGTWQLEPPKMIDLYDKLVDYINGKVETDIPLQHSDIVSATALLNHIKPAAKGAYQSFFNGATNIDLDGKLINYDISGVPESIRDAMMYLLLSNTYEYMVARERGYRSVYLEEAWGMLSSNSEHVKRIVKTCRGFNMSLVVITQDLVDVTGSSAGDAIMGNSATKIILGMDVAYAETVGAMVGLTHSEAATLPTSGKGEGFIIVNGISTRFKTPSAPSEKKLIETGTIAISNSERFDTTRDFYSCKDLSPQQISTLSNLDFERVAGKRLGRGSADYMLLNKTKNQSNEHFIMTHLIDEVARTIGLSSEIHDYGKDFDVTVRNAYGFVLGLEYETGTNNWSDVVAKADRLNNSSEQLEAKEWYFVVPSKLKGKYAEVNSNTVTGGQIASLLQNFAEMTPEIPVETDDQLNSD